MSTCVQLASLEQREGSQYWHVRFRDPATGARTRKATPYRWNNREETRKAREEEARSTFEEKRAPRSTHNDKWQVWVRPFLEQMYHDSPKTLNRYLTCWRNVETFLLEKRMFRPAAVDHNCVVEFITWRRSSRRGRQRKNKKPIATNTISTDLKVLRIVMKEAIKRKFALANPCTDLRLSRKPLREMREIPIEEEKIIRPALEKKPEWMQISFDVAMAQGCRFSETRLDLDRDVDLVHRRVRIHGKNNTVFETALSPLLVPLFTELKRRGQRWTWDLPPNELRYCGRNWSRFFKRTVKLPHLWFHCTRATAITRAHRAGVSYPKARRFFNHASALVHEIYTLLGLEDVSEIADALAAFSVSSGVSPRSRYSATSEPHAEHRALPAKSSDRRSKTRNRARPSRAVRASQ